MSMFRKLFKNEKGATAIEYGLIAALIAVAAIGAMQGIGNSLNNTFKNVSNHLGKELSSAPSTGNGRANARPFFYVDLRLSCSTMRPSDELSG